MIVNISMIDFTPREAIIMMLESSLDGQSVSSHFQEAAAMRIGTLLGMRAGKTFQRASFAGLAALAVFVCTTVSAQADEALSCYKGDKNSSVYIGEISAANIQNAASECNTFFGDCNGQCFGCYLDESSSQEVCVDSQGKKFNR